MTGVIPITVITMEVVITITTRITVMVIAVHPIPPLTGAITAQEAVPPSEEGPLHPTEATRLTPVRTELFR